MSALLRMTAWLVVLQLGHVTVAWACSCIPTDVNEAVASGDAIVVATIVTFPFEPTPTRAAGCGGSDVSSDPASSLVAAEIAVTEVVAGEAAIGTRVVRTSSGGGPACGLDLVEGETWVLQIDPGDIVSLCSVSRRIEGDDDPWLAELRAAAGG